MAARIKIELSTGESGTVLSLGENEHKALNGLVFTYRKEEDGVRKSLEDFSQSKSCGKKTKERIREILEAKGRINYRLLA